MVSLSIHVYAADALWYLRWIHPTRSYTGRVVSHPRPAVTQLWVRASRDARVSLL